MRRLFLTVSAALLVGSLVPGASSDGLARPAAGRAAPPAASRTTAPASSTGELPAMKSLRCAKGDWDGEFSEELQSWTFEKFSPLGDGTFATNRFIVDRIPADAPKDVDGYAALLEKEESFQDIGYVFVGITKKEKTADGWLIVGRQKDAGDATDKGTPAFAMYRRKFGVVCFGADFQSEALRDEAATVCAALASE